MSTTTPSPSSAPSPSPSPSPSPPPTLHESPTKDQTQEQSLIGLLEIKTSTPDFSKFIKTSASPHQLKLQIPGEETLSITPEVERILQQLSERLPEEEPLSITPEVERILQQLAELQDQLEGHTPPADSPGTGRFPSRAQLKIKFPPVAEPPFDRYLTEAISPSQVQLQIPGLEEKALHPEVERLRQGEKFDPYLN